jgi:uncharacterized protein YwgA
MADICDIVVHLLRNYPHTQEMSNARVTKMVYLADWKHAIDNGSQISSIQWHFDNYGPFVWDVKQTVENNPSLFRIDRVTNYFGTPKLLFSLRETASSTSKLRDSERNAINHVIESTKNLGWQAFIQLVYSTYPIIASRRYSSLDLVDLARKYEATT